MLPTSSFYDALTARTREYFAELILSLPALIFGLIVALFFWWLAGRLRTRLAFFSKVAGWPVEVELLVGQILYVGVLVGGAVVVLGIWGQNVTGLVAGLGVVGIAVGFALRNILENFVAGVLLLIQRPFSVGDQIKSGAFEGEVEEISLRATALRTPDHRQIVIPNATLYTNPVTNLTRYPHRRSTVTLTVDPEQTLDLVRGTIIEMVGAVEGVLPHPAPETVVTGLDAGKVTLEVRFWTDSRGATVNRVASQVVQALTAVATQVAADQAIPFQVVKVTTPG